MSVSVRKRWPGLVLLAAGLPVAVALALTWANGQLVRHLLREHSGALERDPTQAWRMEIEELAGDFGTTVFRLRLYDHRIRDVRLELSGRLRHRLLTTGFAGHVYLVAGPDDPQRPRPPARTPLASLDGQARYRPASGVVWSARVQGRGGQLGSEAMNWTVKPWSAVLAGERSARLSLTLPALQLEAPRLGTATVRGAQLKLVNGVPSGAASGLRVRGRARVDTLQLRLPQGPADASGVGLEGHIQRDPGGWPFSLRLSAAELVYKGIPFTRMSDLSYQVDGRASPRGVAARGVVANGGALEWSSSHSLEADTDYGPLRGSAMASGVLGPSPVSRGAGVRLIGWIPRGLWSVLERLNGPLAARLIADRFVKLEDSAVRVQAEYLGAGWRGLVTEP